VFSPKKPAPWQSKQVEASGTAFLEGVDGDINRENNGHVHNLGATRIGSPWVIHSQNVRQNTGSIYLARDGFDGGFEKLTKAVDKPNSDRFTIVYHLLKPFLLPYLCGYLKLLKPFLLPYLCGYLKPE
jgi:hypothetical protein